MRLITVSELKSFRSCPRAHHYHYELGYRSVSEAAPLRFGSLVHAGLEAWFRNGGNIDAALNAIADADGFDYVRASVLLRGYDVRWSAEPWTVRAVEAEFTAPLINPATGFPSKTFGLGGKLDAVIETEDGRAWIVEHKTSAEDIGAGSEYWARLQMDAQVSTYFVGARALGFEPAGCVYDVIGKPSIRPFLATPLESRKYTKAGALYATQHEADETPEAFGVRLAEHVAESPERYYQRGQVMRLHDDELDAGYDAWQTARSIREAELAGRHPRNCDACTRWGRRCEFFDVCARTASLDDTTRFRRAERAHEELSQATQQEGSEAAQ